MTKRSLTRIDVVLAAVMAETSASLIHLSEVMASHAMAVRILDRLPEADAYVALFIALKTECVHSPLTHRILVRLTGESWKALQEHEVEILRDMDWRLYEGALTSP